MWDSLYGNQQQLLSKRPISATTLVLLLHSDNVWLYGSAFLALRILCRARVTIAVIGVLKGIDIDSQEKQLLGKEFEFHGSCLPPAEYFNLEDIVDGS